jgi:hypothetical protein
LYILFFFVYTGCSILWVKNLRRIKKSGGDGVSSVHHVHYMMAFLLILKTATVFLESMRFHYIRVTGQGENLWDIVYYTFAFIKGIALFTTLLLIGSGWSMFKPFLNDKEKKIIFIVLCLQIIDNVALILVANDAPGSNSYAVWRNILHLVDIISCIGILLPVVWQVRQLEAAANVTNEEGGNFGGRNTRILNKLKLFQRFYFSVVGYIYFTRIMVFLFASILTWNQTWWRFFATELGTLLFYVFVGYEFRPVDKNPYLALEQDDSDDERLSDDEHVSELELEEMGGV